MERFYENLLCFMIGLILSCVLFIYEADAHPQYKEYKLINTTEVFIDFKNYFRNGHNPLMPEGSVLNKGVDLNIKTDIDRYFYLNNKVWSLADQHQFRYIGWNWIGGVRLLPQIDLEYEHFSKHILDKEYPYKAQGRFPVEDSINIRFYLYRSDDKPSLLLFN